MRLVRVVICVGEAVRDGIPELIGPTGHLPVRDPTLDEERGLRGRIWGERVFEVQADTDTARAIVAHCEPHRARIMGEVEG